MSVFLEIPEDRIIYKDKYFFIIKDKYPVSEGHSLIISNKLRSDYFDLSEEEKHHLINVIEICKLLIEEEFTPDGYNIGMNCGAVAGQTVMHFHCHLIPRYKGDMANPRGGIRHCVEGKGYY
ncbi:HIT family protein [Pontibacter vulgaris]|uniref:HIT family protein n=1 Tax=Pontibacter vulgaris TaxID=2905679 RepID=UPI001FA75E74|nr:HIT family protein [Pontibacter vulgaris]